MINLNRHSKTEADRLRMSYLRSLDAAENICRMLAVMPLQLDDCTERLLDDWFEQCEEFQEHVRMLALVENDLGVEA